MLTNLHVKNLALIDEIEIEFEKGLNILTGETGAGKSIILGSVQLALGGKYSKEILREGVSYGLVELTFVPGSEALLSQLAELEIFPEDGAVVLSRRLMESRSTCRINGETVNMDKMRRAAQILIDIHGQQEHQTLLSARNQRNLIDAYAGDHLFSVRCSVRDLYRRFRDITAALEKAVSDERERAKEMDFLEYETGEIRSANLISGEDEELEREFRRMNNARTLMEDADGAYALTAESMTPGAGEQLDRAIRLMSDAARYDKQAEGLYEQLVQLDGLLNDFNRELAQYRASLEFSEEDYHNTEERLDVINRLKTKYGQSIEEILSYCKEKEERLAVLADYDTYLSSLKEELKMTEASLKEKSDELGDIRRAEGKTLGTAVEAALNDLNFQDVRFAVDFEKLDRFTAEGTDDVRFMVSMNPGQPLRSLADVASGGELSRTMLAIKSVMAGKEDIETLIFDEIDAGISGRTAQKVSEKMAFIANDRQVICITHLAQIAAMADAHYVIEKTVEEGQTRTGIRKISEAEIVDELARILGGAKITEAVIENATEMKKLAKDYKKLYF